MNKSIVFVITLVASFSMAAQEHFTHFCGQVSAQQKLYGQHSHASEEAQAATAELETFTQDYIANRGGDDEILTIPVVFHVIHMGGDENIPDVNMHDALAVLTRDFRFQNPDASQIVEEFQDIASDCKIEFKMATRDPNGNCHTGINRVVSELTYDGYNGDLKDLSYWPRDSYLNIWVCNTIGDNTAGFTNLPGDVASNWAASHDGIVIRYDYVGHLEPSQESHSRTLTHEVGHWLNLYHCWGPTNEPGVSENCETDDLVSDTPNTIGYTSCTLNGASCGSELDNVQNYMEYSYCSKMFTWGQRQRMRAALNSNTADRNDLITQANLIQTGVLNPPLCEAMFTSPQTSACVGDVIQFNDLSYNGIVSWSWNFGDGETLSGSDPAIHKNPEHLYDTAGIFSVQLEVSNGDDELSTTEVGFITIFDTGQVALPFSEGFENSWPGNAWVLNNPDADETWEITPAASFSGDKSLKLRNFSIDAGRTDELYTATFDMTGADTVLLSYKWAYANKTNETDDRFRIMASGDCGNTWVVRKIRKGSTNLPTADPTNTQFTPTSESDWNGETLELLNPDWFNDRFRIKFDFNALGGNNFYLDDINIMASMPTGIVEAKPLFVYNVYPNPSAGDMTLEVVQVNKEPITIELYNATGQLCEVLFRGQLGSGQNRISVPKQPTGLYNIVLKNNNHINVQKVIFN